MAKKRTSLDALFAIESASPNEPETAKPASEIQLADGESQNTAASAARKTPAGSPAQTKSKNTPQQAVEESPAVVKTKGEIVKQTVYLPASAHEQLRQLAFEERKKMHDYIIEGLDRVFKNRGLKPFVELSDKAK